MNHLLFKLFFSAMSLYVTVTYGQEKPVSAFFSGRIVSGAGNHADSIRVMIRSNYLVKDIGEETHLFAVQPDGTFSFEIPAQKQPAQMYLYLFGKKSRRINDFWIDQNDSLFIDVGFDEHLTVNFSGRGAAKYRCRQVLADVKAQFDSARHNRSLYDLVPVADDIEALYRIYSTYLTKSQALLETYKGVVDTEVFELMKSEHLAAYHCTWELQLQNFYNRAVASKNFLLATEITSAYRKHILQQLPILTVSAHSPMFTRYRLEVLKTDMLMAAEGKGYTFKAMYDQISQRHRGLLRDKLLVYYLLDHRSFSNVVNYNQQEYDECLSDAYEQVETSYIREVIASKFILSKGSKLMSFAMPDTTGKTVKSEDFKGKVILLDLWGEGCTGCVSFSKMLDAKIHPEFVGNQDFQVVSISIDKTRERWIRGIHSGRYTHPGNINLFTDGMGLDHPFTRYYRISAIPFILLVDKEGKIYAQVSGGISAEELLKVIKQALKS